MTEQLAPASPDDGGCSFAPDPDLAVAPAAVVWRPDVSPASVILDAAPDGFAATPLDVTRLGPPAAEVLVDDERVLVVLAHGQELQLRLRGAVSVLHPAVLVPIDALVELRLAVALRLVRKLAGQQGDLLPTSLRLTSAQKDRLIRLLHAFDIRLRGGGPRDVASEVLNSEQARLPSIEWKDSHARRAANRLIHDASALVDHGYLDLVRGR